MARMDAFMDQMMGDFCVVTWITGCIMVLIGFFEICFTFSRWNRHRRDIILITLLREKCAAELAMPPPQSPQP